MNAKIRRFLTSFLPVSAARQGQCVNCGACCKLPNPCPFLREAPGGQSRCAVYALRPPSCRKYPRTAAEFVTPDGCGYRFDAVPTEAPEGKAPVVIRGTASRVAGN